MNRFDLIKIIIETWEDNNIRESKKCAFSFGCGSYKHPVCYVDKKVWTDRWSCNILRTRVIFIQV